jgi:hypothetical protein
MLLLDLDRDPIRSPWPLALDRDLTRFLALDRDPIRFLDLDRGPTQSLWPQDLDRDPIRFPDLDRGLTRFLDLDRDLIQSQHKYTHRIAVSRLAAELSEANLVPFSDSNSGGSPA